MSENRTRLKFLINQYGNNVATAEEEYELFGLIGETSNDEFEGVLAEMFEEQQPAYEPERTNRNLNKTLNHITSEPLVRKLYPWKRWVAAAAILVVILSVTFLITTRSKDEQIAETKHEVKNNQDVAAPNKTKATIKLADGSIITLDEATTGTLAQQGNVNVIKTADGKIIYNGSSTEVAFNTLTNPRGSVVIDMTLADGSRVWLNAGSSVTYPVAFVGNERKVSITGEAYFEVKPDATAPFKVNKGDMEVQVLGTHFNVNAYDDEANVKVTLLEGSVKITKANSSGLLKPGQQAKVGDAVQILNNVDLDEVMAWKNGRFYFNGADIQTIMRQVARWYDVEVVYEGGIPTGHYNGKPSRDLTVSEMLKVVEYSGVKVRIEGRKIIILK